METSSASRSAETSNSPVSGSHGSVRAHRKTRRELERPKHLQIFEPVAKLSYMNLTKLWWLNAISQSCVFGCSSGHIHTHWCSESVRKGSSELLLFATCLGFAVWLVDLRKSTECAIGKLRGLAVSSGDRWVVRGRFPGRFPGRFRVIGTEW